MEFEGIKLNDVLVNEVMNTSIHKVSMTETIQSLIQAIVKDEHKIIIVVESKWGHEIVKGVIDAKDVLKMLSEELSLEAYINKYMKRLDTIVNEKESVGKIIKDLVLNSSEYMMVEEDNKITGIIGIDEIMSLRIDVLNENCDRLLTILDDINVAVSVVDEKYITKFWNKSAEKMYNISRSEILNRPITDFFPNALLPKVIKEQKPYKNVYNSPRENCYNIISATPLYDGEKLIGGIGYDRDISELMRVSELLHKTQSNLEILEEEVSKLSESRYSFSQIIGNNENFKQAVKLARNVAKSNISILLTGESGTGKEVFSRAIHIESGRKGYFVPINCSAIPMELMESELFGYEKGAFTGAAKEGKSGKFELANNGTLFLDEIGDMSLSMQPKILRVLEDGIITRIGSDKPIKVDVRIIAATNKDIKKMVEEGTFRKDLYYRLNSILINLPPLRKRKEDIPELVIKFVEDFCIEYRTNIKEIDRTLMNTLINYDWEGNIRELKNIVERMVILAKNHNVERLDTSLLPESVCDESNHNDFEEWKFTLDIRTITENAEKEAIRKAMEISKGNKAHAANLLNIPRSTLYFKLDKYKMEE